MMKNRFEELKESVRATYDNSDPSHDFVHIERVLASCRRLAETVSADLDILLPAALLHDIVNVPKNHPDRLRASEQAAEQAGTILEKFGYTKNECERIGQVILEHSFSRGLKASSIESACLQDADRLDAIGAIGLMRVTTCGTKMGSSYYESSDPLARSRELQDRRYILDHFEVKLFRLAEGMNTEYGKTEGARRAQFMRGFVEQLISELP